MSWKWVPHWFYNSILYYKIHRVQGTLKAINYNYKIFIWNISFSHHKINASTKNPSLSKKEIIKHSQQNMNITLNLLISQACEPTICHAHNTQPRWTRCRTNTRTSSGSNTVGQKRAWMSWPSCLWAHWIIHDSGAVSVLIFPACISVCLCQV